MHTIRRADPADAEPMSLLAERSFREAFSALNTAENMDQHCRASYGVSIQAAEISHPSRITLIAELAGVPIGFAQLRFAGAPSCVPGNSPGEIHRLYVASGWHGKGVALDLITGCFHEIKGRGHDVVWLGVWEHNPRARAFYGKVGFLSHGEQVFQLGSDPQRDVVMAMRLDGVRSAFLGRH